MYFRSWEELKKLCPIKNGKWNKEILYEYLVWSCNKNFRDYIDNFFQKYQQDEKLAELLFDFIFNDEFDGSDSQMGAARYIARLDKELLKKNKDLLMMAQENEVKWKRPFIDEN